MSQFSNMEQAERMLHKYQTWQEDAEYEGNFDLAEEYEKKVIELQRVLSGHTITNKKDKAIFFNAVAERTRLDVENQIKRDLRV